MNGSPSIIVLMAAGERYGLKLEAVDRVVRLVEITRLPDAPDDILGVINFQGTILPVIDLRSRFGLPSREPGLSDQLIVARARRRSVALLVDAVIGVESTKPADWADIRTLVHKAGCLAGAVKREDGLILIHDLDTLLPGDDMLELDAALASVKGGS